MRGVIARQSLWASVINYAGSAVGLFTTFYLFPLVYTVEENGIIRMFIELGALLAGVAQLGTGYSIWKFFPRFKNEEKGHHGVGFWLLLIPFAGFLLVSLALLFFQPQVVSYLEINSAAFLNYYYLLIPFIFFFSYNTVLEVFSASLSNILFSSFIRENVVRIMLGLIGFVFYLSWIDFDTAVKLTPAVYALAAFLNLWFVLRITRLSFRPDFGHIAAQSGMKKEFSVYTGYLFLTYTANLFIQRLDFVMISGLDGLVATGVYSIAVNMAVIIEIPTRSILQISNPVLSDAMHRGDKQEMQRLYQKTTLNQFIIGAIVLLMIWVNIDLFYHWMPNGEKYEPGKWAVLILGMGKLCLLLQGNSSAILIFSHRYYLSLIINAVCLATGILLNNYMIPLYGIEGAATATALVWLMGALVTGAIIWFMYRLNPYNSKVFIMAGVLAILLMFITWVQITGVFWFDVLLKNIVIIAALLFVLLKFKLSEDIESMGRKLLAKLGFGKA
jgi:O-antigen/teichoic acid export membrane protein